MASSGASADSDLSHSRSTAVRSHPRDDIGRTLHGDILEIGPGHNPFPTGADARVRYADRSVTGGRDAIWPELAGQPRGPDADFDINLDVDGLAAFPDAELDVVIACHVIEHLANPVAALREFERVLRPGGRLVLVVPDRTRTFDSVREPTRFAHLLDEFDRAVTNVDAEHVKDFCQAIYSQPAIHPEEVREWHNPARLDDALLDLHRLRSIHVHCWTPEEFAVAIAGGLSRGLMSWRLTDLYFFDDVTDRPEIEFGLVLERPMTSAAPAEQCSQFVRDWTTQVLSVPSRDPQRVVDLHMVLLRDLAGWHDASVTASIAARALGSGLATARARCALVTRRLSDCEARIGELLDQPTIPEARRTWALTNWSHRLSRTLASWRLRNDGSR